MWPLKLYLGRPVVSIIKEGFLPPTEPTHSEKRHESSYTAIFNYSVERYTTDDEIRTVKYVMQPFKQQDLMGDVTQSSYG